MIGFNNMNMWNNSVYNQQNFNYYGNKSQGNYLNNFFSSFMMGLLSSMFQDSGLFQNAGQPAISQNVNYNGNGLNSTSIWNNIGGNPTPGISQNVVYNGSGQGINSTNIWNNIFGNRAFNQTQIQVQKKPEKVFVVGSYKNKYFGDYKYGKTNEGESKDGVEVNLGRTILDFAGKASGNGKRWDYRAHDKDTSNNEALQKLYSKLSDDQKKLTFDKGQAYLITESGNIIGTVANNQVGKVKGNSDIEKNDKFKVIDGLGVDKSIEMSNEESNGGKIEYNGRKYDVVSTVLRKNTPLILDLKGDGIELTNHKDGVNFDLNADGKTDQTAWTKKDSDDAFLVLDKDSNGQIDSGKELFGDQNGSENGFLELSKYDSNKDGKVDAKDEVYSKLQTWQDKDHDGKVDKGELKSLVDSNIKSISTGFKEETDETGKLKEDEHGNTVGLVGEFEKTDGTKQTMIDALLQNIG